MCCLPRKNNYLLLFLYCIRLDQYSLMEKKRRGIVLRSYAKHTLILQQVKVSHVKVSKKDSVIRVRLLQTV